MFTTDRLHLREYRATDIERIIGLYNDPVIAPYITHGFVVPRNPENFDKTLQKLKESIMFCVVERLGGSNPFVGFTCFLPQANPKDRDLTFAIAIHQHFWHRGYGSEITRFMTNYGFRSLAAHRVSLTVVEGNDRAIGLYKRL
jgi:RimJ/RimL family protein N-acetyltransferase